MINYIGFAGIINVNILMKCLIGEIFADLVRFIKPLHIVVHFLLIRRFKHPPPRQPPKTQENIRNYRTVGRCPKLQVSIKNI